jgi:hypothetical protein
MKKQAGDVKLKIADSAGREVREISGTALANSGKPGMQSACWDLRVQPVPAAAAAPGGFGGRQGAAGGGGAGGGGGRGGQQTPSPFGAGCGTGGGGFGGFGGFGGGANPGPFVLPGVYHVSLVVDGTTVDTKPLRVVDDPDIVLTSVERKKLFDMAMEIQELQKRGTETANALAPFNTKVNELTAQVSGDATVPADVKQSFDQFSKDLAEIAAKFAQPAGGRGFGGGGGAGAGGRGGGGTESVMAQAAQMKNALMGGMWPTEQTMKAYSDVKVKMPKAMADASALIAKAQALSVQLAKYNITLTVPAMPATKPSALR